MSLSTTTQQAVLELSDVRVTYRKAGISGGMVEALRGVSLVLKAGAIVGLAGANGAGKTTLIELCVGALRPTAGRVRWGTSTVCNTVVRQQIGFCPDVPSLPPRFTGREALRFFGALDSLSTTEADAKIDYLAERLRLHNALPQRIASLSRGNLQRIGICQALMCKRSVILCDESFAPLDPIAQLDLRELLRDEAREGAAVLVSSHQLDQLAKVADEIVIMRDGEITRRFGQDTANAKQAIVVDISGISSERLAVLHGMFPGAWRKDQVLRIPWANQFVDRNSAASALPSEFHALPIIDVEAFSMETIFLESVA